MSQREMKGGQIETKMIGIDRKALGQNKIIDNGIIQLKYSVQITQRN